MPLSLGLSLSITSWQGGAAPVAAGDSLLLEGDMQAGSDLLLLEGDMQSGADVLLIEPQP